MMGDLTRWVIDEALRQARAWQDEGIEVPIAINLAAANILDAALPDAVAERLAHHGVPGHRLTCELSEHTVMADPRRATEILERLRALGVRLSLDDFGTGQSSLAYLKRLPLDEVKIDRAFVSGMTGDTSDALIVRSTIDLARDLGLEVVAEGVEGEDVLERLRGMRCHEAQGFHLSRPLPARGAGGLAIGARRGESGLASSARTARRGNVRGVSRPATSAAVWRAGLSGTPSFAATSPASVNSRWSERPSPASATQRTSRPVPAAAASDPALQPAAARRAQPHRAPAADLVERERPAQVARPRCAARGARARSPRGGRAARCGSAPRRPWPRARRRSAAAGPRAAGASATSVPTPDALSSAPGEGGTVSACAMTTNRQSRGAVEHADHVARAAEPRHAEPAASSTARPAAAKRRATRSCARRSSRPAAGRAPARASERAKR